MDRRVRVGGTTGRDFPADIADDVGAAGVELAAPPGPIRSWPIRLWPGRSRPGQARARARAFFAGISHDLDQEVGHGLLFLLVPVFIALGIIGYFTASRGPGPGLLLASFLTLSGLAALARRRPVLFHLLVAVLLVTGGMILAKFETWRIGTPMLGSEVSTTLTAGVETIETMANGRVRLTLRVVDTARPVLRYAPERVRVSARRIPPQTQIGTILTGKVRLMPPPGPVRPGSYDFSFRAYFDGIGASGFFLGAPQLAPEQGKAGAWPRLLQWVENARNAIAERIRSRIGGPEGEIAAALIVGVRAGIPEAINEDLRKSGLYHVVSISGLHMALVAGLIMGMIRYGAALFPGFAARHPVKKYAAAVALAASAVYLLFSGMQVAAERSFLMLAVMILAVFFDRSAVTMRNLAISALIVIAVSPHEVMGPSFQMSFAATAALVAAFAAWSRRRIARPARRRVGASSGGRAARAVASGTAGLVATALIAGLATAIYAAYHFQRMSPLSVVSNLFATPVVSMVVMPFGVLAMMAMPFGLDGPFLYVMGRGLAAMNAIAHRVAEMSPVDAVGVVPASATVLLTISLLCGTLFSTRLRLAALPFALAGLLLLPSARIPDVLVSEDGRLVGLRLEDGSLAVNRRRPNAFTIEDWQRALRAGHLVAPKTVRQGKAPAEEPGFVCDDGFCLAGTAGGRKMAVLADSAGLPRACAEAELAILSVLARTSCPSIAVIGLRELARNGAAAVSFQAPGQRPVVQHAIAEPYRPWHRQRQFSRAARGLEPAGRGRTGSRMGVAAR